MSRSVGRGVAAALSALVMVLFANLPLAEAGGNCGTKLIGKAFNCSANDSESGPYTSCGEFETGGLSSDFDFFYGLADYGCECDTTGSVNSPDFDGSSAKFECLDDNIKFGLTGTVKGKKLSLQLSTQSGVVEIGSCTERSSPCP